MAEKEIKTAMKEKKLVIGSRSVLKNLKSDNIESVICASNCPDNTYGELRYYGKHFGVEVKRFSGNSRRLGEICGKPFGILVLGIKK